VLTLAGRRCQPSLDRIGRQFHQLTRPNAGSHAGGPRWSGSSLCPIPARQTRLQPWLDRLPHRVARRPAGRPSSRARCASLSLVLASVFLRPLTQVGNATEVSVCTQLKRC
jgi:hypothetical protein